MAYLFSGAYLLELRQPANVSIQWAETALATARRLDELDNEGAILGNLAYAYGRSGDSQRTIELYEQARAKFSQLGDDLNQSVTYNNMGMEYLTTGKPRRAIELYEEALRLANNDSASISNAWGNLGGAYLQLGDTRRAANYYRDTLTLAKQHKLRRNIGRALGGFATVYYELEDYQRAYEHYKEFLLIAHAERDYPNEGSALAGLGEAYRALGKRHHAHRGIAICAKALEIIRETGNHLSEVDTLCSLGKAHVTLGEPNFAIELSEEARAIAQKITYPSGTANALVSMSLALYKQGNWGRAISCAEEALDILQMIEQASSVARIRKQIDEWHRQANKQWWQFWR